MPARRPAAPRRVAAVTLRPAGRPACPEPRTVEAEVRGLVGAAEAEPPGVEEAAACEAVSRDPRDGDELGPLDGEFDPGSTGGVLTGGVLTGREGVLTAGVVMLGVLTCGVVICGVVICGVVMGSAVTVGAVTVGTVTGGTVTDGTDTGGSGDDAVAGVTGTTSAATLARTISTARAEDPPVATTREHLPHGSSTNDGVDIAHRLGPAHSARPELPDAPDYTHNAGLTAGRAHLRVRLDGSPTGIDSAGPDRARSNPCSGCDNDRKRSPSPGRPPSPLYICPRREHRQTPKVRLPPRQLRPTSPLHR